MEHSQEMVTQKMNDLTTSLENFKERFEKRLKTLERVGIAHKRPSYGLKTSSGDISTDEQDALDAFKLYVRKGDESGLLGLTTKALTSDSESDGGLLIPTFISNHIQNKVDGLSPLRDLASVIKISTNSVEILKDENTAEVGWVAETGKRKETATPKLHKIKIPVHEMFARPRVTQRLLDDATLDLENWLTWKIAAKMAQMENMAFLYGDGQEKPRGILNYETRPTEKRDKQSFEHIQIDEKVPFTQENAFDVLIDLMNLLKPEYHRDAVWVMSRSAHALVRKFKDQTGQFLWQPSIGEGSCPTLLGYKVKVVEGMPEITGEEEPKIPIIFGNFKEAYQIVDRMEAQVLRDPYSSKPYVEFYTTRRVGGDVINFDALKMVRFDSFKNK